MARVELTTDAFMRDVRERVARGVKAVAQQSEDHMRELLQVPYPPSSAPGESPHKRTGNLQDSCYSVPLDATNQSVTWRVGNDAEYAIELEEGLFEGGGNFGGGSERPFIRPTFYGFAMAHGPRIFAEEMI